ncbi:MAG: DUF2059 domain-containing protein [Candidatus Obscuribacter sp.]|jgi:hypothetical protein|nr:DUF2059 domain-containing protein [Candidatus Obscuribacter sp.]MBP6593560.1 DUF2059 domain-containing protein [Candidatus Obscuribacter sp.]MBP7576597.1 DUF2059 domain-containing protein [Candidatus Obscuribacter sp.]
MRALSFCLFVLILQSGAIDAIAQMPPPGPPPPIPQELLDQEKAEKSGNATKDGASSGTDSGTESGASTGSSTESFTGTDTKPGNEITKDGSASTGASTTTTTSTSTSPSAPSKSLAAQVTPAKRALIVEYLELCGRLPRLGAQTRDVLGAMQTQKVVKKFSAQLPEIFSQIPTGAPQPTASQQKAMIKDVQAGSQRMLKRASESFGNDKQLQNMMEDTLVSVYDRHFSEEELQAMIDFYNTPVGAKLSRQQSTIDREIMNLMMPQTMEPAMQIFKQFVKEDKLFKQMAPKPVK